MGLRCCYSIEPDLWDLPGGGLNPEEDLMTGLRREVQEETGISQFQVDGLLTVVEQFFSWTATETQHTLNLVYRCAVSPRLAQLVSDDPQVGAWGNSMVGDRPPHPRAVPPSLLGRTIVGRATLG
ncbi:MAG: NUDIX hydrolase [Kaiparowitsia implicata GSE-PSE-MK54-09C]|jgi:8-oxo-dGTP pyrophosphatase MutT (NUDIX family)|nr:NUDIX hydrolase [Kaiparowitsia implicata GSE-PSE-MK54-09C]